MKIITVVFFAFFLLLGILIYNDYGVYWDEITEIKRGEAALEFMSGQENTLSEKYYGASWEITMALTRIILGLNDPRQIIMTRHLANFCLFYLALICFYSLVRKKFGGYFWPLTAVILLIFSPRIFADAFYNSKNLVFLSVFIINIWSLLFCFRQKKFSQALLHGAITAFLIDIRPLGLMYRLPFW